MELKDAEKLAKELIDGKREFQESDKEVLLKLIQKNRELKKDNLFFQRICKSEDSELHFTREMLENLSKKAMMADMTDAIAHQWLQPLGVISLYSKMLVNDFDYGDIDRGYLLNFVNKIDIQVDHLTETLHEFREFFRPNKKREAFSVRSAINSVLLIMQDTIKGNQISVNVEDKDFQIFGYKNEFKHVIINIISNAKDVFVERETKKRVINVKILTIDNRDCVIVDDNAGGIPTDVINRVFEQNFTTKEKSGGTGIGLCISKKIVEKFGGSINVENIENGAEFRICFDRESV